MRRLGIVAVLLGLVLVLAAVTTSSARVAPSASGPPPLQASQAAAAATITIGWSVQFGSGYGTHPQVSSARNPSWTVYGESTHTAVLVFQSDCNLVDRFNQVVQWASNTVNVFRPCVLDFPSNGDAQIRNSAGQRQWHTSVVHTGTVFTVMAFYSNSCLVEFYWNAPTQRWINAWRSFIGHGVDCSVITA